MSYEIAVQIILVCSLIGMGVIIFRKIPILAELSEISAARISLKESLFKLKEKIKILNHFKSFSYEIFLQKILSRFRILSLRAENKSFNWLQKLRERAQRKKIEENDNYWEEIKKITKEK